MTQRIPNDPKDGFLAYHTKEQLLSDLQWHVGEALLHLSHYRHCWPESPIDTPLSAIWKHLHIAMGYMAFGEPEEKEAQ